MKRLAALLLVKPDELGRLAYFFAFFALLGAGIAVGKGSADAMFLKRYGVEYFPYVYMVLSIALAVSFILYAAFVDRIASERFFRIIFGVEVMVLLLTAVAIQTYDNDLIFPAYYMVYAIASELLVIHGAMYIGQNFNTLQSKRLTPLIFAGYQIGMICGGFILIFTVAQIGLDDSPLVWAALVVVAYVLMLVRHRNAPSPYYFATRKTAGSRLSRSLNELGEGLSYMRNSSLLRNASFAMFFMVVTYYMLSYSVHTIYTTEFTDEAALTGFFGVLVIATNALALFIQVFVSNRIINHFGVRRANYIYPVTTLLSFGFLLFNPAFYAALFASFNRESIMPAIRTPTRQLFFNVLPDHIKGRARAMSGVIVMPLALFSCGGLIILLKQIEGLEPVAVAGLVCSAIYLFYAWRMGKDYIVTLIASMREKLYLPGKPGILYRDSGREVLNMMQQGLDNEDADVSLSYARALLDAYPGESLPMILKRVRTLDNRTADQMMRLVTLPGPQYIPELESMMQHADSHLQATILDIILAVDETGRDNKIRLALSSGNQRLVASAVHAVYIYEQHDLFEQALQHWKQLVSGDNNSLLASLRLLAIIDRLELLEQTRMSAVYMASLSRLLQTMDRARQATVLESLQAYPSRIPADLSSVILAYRDDHDPEIRAAATGLLRKISSGDQFMAYIWHSLSDGHARVRMAAVNTLSSFEGDFSDHIYKLLLDNRDGVPRAHQVLLQQLISHGARHIMLEEILHIKIRYAANLICAIAYLEKTPRGDARELLLIAMQERLQQINDLVLICLEPMTSSASIAVIRAGLQTRDDRHIANAVEALESISNDKLVVTISSLVKGDARKIKAEQLVAGFDDENEVLHWCTQAGDWWLRECCMNIMNNANEGASHA